MRRKRTLFLAFFLFVIGGLLIVFFKQTTNNNDAHAHDKTINIGAILPLTGSVAFVGVPIKNSILLKIEELNVNENVKLNVLFEDSKADVKEAVSALEKLKLQGIDIVLGPVTSGEVLAASPIAEKSKIILLSPSASAQNISLSGDYIFRNELSDSLGAILQAQIAFDTLKWKKISILYTDNDYGYGVKNSFEKEFIRLGGKIENSISFKGGSTDFRTQIVKLKEKANDAIFIVAQAEYPIIIKQIRENNILSKIYATPVFEDPSFVEMLGSKNSEGILYTYYGSFDMNSKSQTISKFVESYTSRYGTSPTYYAALGYDNISLIIKALQNSNYNTKAIKESLYAIKKFDGVTGQMSFDENGDIVKPVMLKVVKDGKFTNYKNKL